MIIRQLDFYIDGAYSSKTQDGGWASICIEDGAMIAAIDGCEPYTTINRVPLWALLNALETIDTIESGHTKVRIFTKNSYIYNCFNEKWYLTWMSNGWRTSDRQAIKNQDLWAPAIALYIKAKNKFGLEIIKDDGKNEWLTYAHLCADKKRKEFDDKLKETN